MRGSVFSGFVMNRKICHLVQGFEVVNSQAYGYWHLVTEQSLFSMRYDFWRKGDQG